jgi:hypothetical protein
MKRETYITFNYVTFNFRNSKQNYFAIKTFLSLTLTCKCGGDVYILIDKYEKFYLTEPRADQINIIFVF